MSRRSSWLRSRSAAAPSFLKSSYARHLRAERLEDRRMLATFAEFVDPNPSPGNDFGDSVVALETGNVVITAPGDDAGGTDAGAVYLFNGATGDLISSLVGSSAFDRVGDDGVVALDGGNYVVLSSLWDNGVATDAGAVTFGSGESGVSGAVSAANSLVGSSAGDSVGSDGVVALDGGNYVVRSSNWDNGVATNAGAVTFGSWVSGVSGVVTVNNSLVGSSAEDRVGSSGVVALDGGNYVVRSSNWDNGTTTDAGAVTFGSGVNGVSGVVTVNNSLVGSSAGDFVGIDGVVALDGGNYVVRSPIWDNGTTTNAGAVTFGSGVSGVSGEVSAANSLVGSSAEDRVGSTGVVALDGGNYVVRSSSWDNGGVTDAGAVTFGGASGVSGVVSDTNSLVGSSADDLVGSFGVVALDGGNYVVRSSSWDNGTTTDVGAVTFGSGMNGVSGEVSAANSLVGSSANDRVGSFGVVALDGGNYVVLSSSWGNGGVTDAGAVTFGSGMNGVSGAVSDTNSLVGSSAGDSVGNSGVVALDGGNYVVRSSNWDNGVATNAGAVTFGSGVSGVSGVVTVNNSLVGSSAEDRVGSSIVEALDGGNYVVRSPNWDNGTTTNAGAVTFGSGVSGVAGAVSAANSLVGSSADDFVGSSRVVALDGGNYLVRSPIWDNGTTTNAGAVTFGSGVSGVSGAVTAANSLVGSSASDTVGSSGVVALDGGNYVVLSSSWDNGGVTDAGAVTFGSGMNGVSGAVSDTNSLVGSSAFDFVGNSGVVALDGGNYVVRSSNWDNGVATNAGAVTFGSAVNGGAVGEINFLNSAFGLTSSAGLQSVVVDEVNGNFFAPFVDEGGGRVRVGSQALGFPDVTDSGDTDDGDIRNGVTTLREAINLANATPAADIISFAVTGTIDLGSQLPTIIEDLTIDGGNRVTLDAGNGTDNTFATGDGYRIFNVDDGDLTSQIDVTLSGLTLTGGDPNASDLQGSGGAIHSREDLTVTSSTISANFAPLLGGGIFSEDGDLTVTSSTIAGNAAFFGGGIYSDTNLDGTQTTSITGSTISANTAGSRGGGVHNEDGLTVITQSTITANTAAVNQGSGVASFGDADTRTEISSTIIVGNTNEDVAVTDDPSNNSFQSNGYNLIGTGGGVLDPLLAFNKTGDQTGVTNAKLGPLADNGGPTLTHALLPGSPAIDAAPTEVLLFGPANTGLDTDRVTLLGDSEADPNFELIAQPSGSTLTAIAVIEDGFPIGPWVENNGTSRWIGPNTNPDAEGPGGVYIYRTEFDLTGFDTSYYDFKITGEWALDNRGAILLNGRSTSQTINSQTTSSFSELREFLIEADDGFVNGVNTLDFVVFNDGAGPTGLRVDDIQLFATLENSIDQRGFARSVDGGSNGGNGGVDIGAFEAQGVVSLPDGDYNGDGIANAADYTVWRDTLTSTTDLRADGDGNLVVDNDDYLFWRQNYGNTTVREGQITAGIELNFDAALDLPGDSLWADAQGGIDYEFTNGDAEPVVVTDSPLLNAAYDIGSVGGAEGANGYYAEDGQFIERSREDATFEVWFKKESLSIGDQVLYEGGGQGRGFALVLSEDALGTQTLWFNIKGDGPTHTITHEFEAPGQWNHAVAVIDMTGNHDGLANDAMRLYVGGVLVASLDGLLINDWAGSGTSGLGDVAFTAGGGGSFDRFDGLIASFRYYQNTAFGAGDARHQFKVPQPPALPSSSSSSSASSATVATAATTSAATDAALAWFAPPAVAETAPTPSALTDSAFSPVGASADLLLFSVLAPADAADKDADFGFDRFDDSDEEAEEEAAEEGALAFAFGAFE